MKITKLLLYLLTAGGLVSSLNTTSAADFQVQMTGSLTFAPSSLSIAQGDTVTWTNAATFHHDSSSGATPGTPDGIWTSGVQTNQGMTYTLAFNNFAPGTYPYFCQFHFSFGMIGSITVTNGTIVQPVLTNGMFATSGTFQLSVNGSIGLTNITESSPDLLNWSPVSTNLAVASSYTVTNLPFTGFNNGFYRVRIGN